jgi:hypothetical protein
MVAYEPRVRRRGYFLHSADTGEAETGDHETAEGINVRVRTARSETPRQFSSIRRSSNQTSERESQPEIRSGSVTGSLKRAHLPR